MKIFGLILAGGEGKRIGGNKPLVELFQKPLIYWALKPYLELALFPLISVRDASQAKALEEALNTFHLKEKRDYAFVFDAEPFLGLGPLSGLYSAMNYLENTLKERGLLLLSGVDQPLLTPSLFAPLLNISQFFLSLAVIYRVNETPEPFPGVYPSSLLQELSFFLRHSLQKSFKNFLAFLAEKNLLVQLNYFYYNRSMLPLLNINTPEDLRRIKNAFLARKI